MQAVWGLWATAGRRSSGGGCHTKIIQPAVFLNAGIIVQVAKKQQALDQRNELIIFRSQNHYLNKQFDIFHTSHI